MSSRDRIPDHPEELLLLDYLSGQLAREATDQIKRHVSTCRACRRTVADLSLTVEELDRLPTVAIPHDSPYDAGQRRIRRPRRFTTYLPALLILAGGLAVLALIGLDRTAAAPGVEPVTLRVTATEADLQHAALSDPSRVVAFDSARRLWIVLVSRDSLARVLARVRALPTGAVVVLVDDR